MKASTLLIQVKRTEGHGRVSSKMLRIRQIPVAGSTLTFHLSVVKSIGSLKSLSIDQSIEASPAELGFSC